MKHLDQVNEGTGSTPNSAEGGESLSNYYCDANTRQETSAPRCTQRAGWGTDHPGLGRCKLHGGSVPVKTGRYSKIRRMRIAELMEELRSDPEPLELMEEVLLLRAMTIDLVERWEDVFGVDGALLQWYESYKSSGDVRRPRQLPDFSNISQLVDRVGVMVDRVVKQKEAKSMPFDEVRRILTLFGQEVALAVSAADLENDTEARVNAAIRKRVSSIQIVAPVNAR